MPNRLTRIAVAVLAPSLIGAGVAAIYDVEVTGAGAIIGALAWPALLCRELMAYFGARARLSLLMALIIALGVGFSFFGLTALRIIDAEPAAVSISRFGLSIYTIVAIGSFFIVGVMSSSQSEAVHNAKPFD